MILTDLSNTIKTLWEKISFHKHFKSPKFFLSKEHKYNSKKSVYCECDSKSEQLEVNVSK